MPDLQTLPATDLLYRYWPASPAQAILLLVHGLGAHSARWEFLAAYFSSRGFAVVAPELRGFGETPGPRGHVKSFRIYDADLLKLRAEMARNHPNRKIFLVAESLGGLVSFALTAQHPHAFAGLVLISPAFQNAMRFRFRDYVRTFSSLIFNPKALIPMPFTAAMCTRDQAFQKSMEADSRELRVASANLLLQTLLRQMQAPGLAASLQDPVLFLLAGRDYLVNPKASQRMFGRLAVQDKKLILYPDMLHALSIDLGREQVFADIEEWLKNHL